MRRAWIEIVITDPKGELLEVALHAESVDRNNVAPNYIKNVFVALHAESVDRNTRVMADLGVATSRSPCGERG